MSDVPGLDPSPTRTSVTLLSPSTTLVQNTVISSSLITEAIPTELIHTMRTKGGVVSQLREARDDRDESPARSTARTVA